MLKLCRTRHQATRGDTYLPSIFGSHKGGIMSGVPRGVSNEHVQVTTLMDAMVRRGTIAWGWHDGDKIR